MEFGNGVENFSLEINSAEEGFKTFRFPLAQVLPSLEQACEYIHVEALAGNPSYDFLGQKLQELQTLPSEAVGGWRLARLTDMDTAAGHISLAVAGIPSDSAPSETAVAGELNPGHQVCSYIKECDCVALFLCTAGHLFRRQYEAYNRQGDILEAYLVDALGSLTVENAMDRIHEALAGEMASHGLRITNRYSPGYCNWPVTDQVNLFALVGANPTGISLNDSCLMSPIKSVSGLIGIGAKARRRAYGCAVCQSKTCIYRKLTRRE